MTALASMKKKLEKLNIPFEVMVVDDVSMQSAQVFLLGNEGHFRPSTIIKFYSKFGADCAEMDCGTQITRCHL